MNILKIKNLIIGAGISGCVLAELLNKDEYVILEKNSCEKIGGEMENKILGPKFFHSTELTKSFFEKYIINTKNVKSITINNGTKCDDLEAYNKKIGYSFKNSKNSSIDSFEALELDLNEFYKKNIISNVNILKIDTNKHIVYCLHKQQLLIVIYNNIISTIDFNIFANLCDIKKHFDLINRPVVYMNFVAKYKKEFEYLSKYDFWYNLTNNEFFRCTNLKNSVTVELFLENLDSSEIVLQKYFYNIDQLKYFCNNNAKIWNNSKDNQIKFDCFKDSSIYLLGRNALYNHDRIQDSIELAYKIKQELQ